MYFRRILLIITVTLTGTFIAKSQTADEIIAKHIEAIGGEAAWKKVNTLKIHGSLDVQGTDIKISLMQLHGRGMRQDIALQGMEGYQIVTPTQGWTFMPFRGQTQVAAMSEEEVKQAQSELDTHGSLLEYKEKGHTAELAGRETIDGIECYKLILSLNSGKKETAFIDSKNYYVVRTTTMQKVNGQDQELETSYSAFEKLPEGIVIAKSLTLPYGTMTLNKVEVNKPIDERVFSPAYDKVEGHESQ